MLILDYQLIVRALRTHELALKQAINNSNRAVAEIEKRPYRPAESDLLAHKLSARELAEIEQELSRVAMQVLAIEHMYDSPT